MAETLERFESTFYFSAEDRRRATVGLVKRGSVGSLAAEDVKERLQAIEASLRGFRANP